MYDEKNTGSNLPAQIDLYATDGDEYEFLFIAKGGGSANKTALFQQTKALLNPDTLLPFLVEKMKSLGTAACPPYHIAFVIGGTSADWVMKMVKLASTGYCDNMPTTGDAAGRAFRDLELEQQLLAASRTIGLGAQFGGPSFAHDIRVIRGPRHGASCPVGMAVSCSAHRNVRAKITKDGMWIEKLDKNPARWLEDAGEAAGDEAVKIDLDQPMDAILAELTKYPVKTRLSLTGTMVVGRDIAHAKIKERIDAGENIPEYLQNHPIYYAGPAKTPEGMASGSFGPTTAGRMDSYVDLFQSLGGSKIMIAKGNRSQAVTDACKKHGGFYLGIDRRAGRRPRQGEHHQGGGRSSTPSSAWRPSGRSKWRTSRRSSWWTTRGTTFFKSCSNTPARHRAHHADAAGASSSDLTNPASPPFPRQRRPRNPARWRAKRPMT